MNVLIPRFKTFHKIAGSLLLTVSLAHVCMGTSGASANASNKANPTISRNNATLPSPWYKDIKAEWGGHIKGRGRVSWPDDRSVFQPVGTGTFYDGNTEARLNNRLFFGKWGYLETHYEMILSGGWTRSKRRELEKVLRGLFRDGLMISRPIEDDRRFMDLTKTVDRHDDYILYHRLDRLSLTLLPKWGVVRIGRQAVTWGNGLLFNPMDMFNPFSPADIERDYKIADDMVSAQFSIGIVGDLQFLYVPRRKPSGGDLEWNQSSLAGKLHFAWGTTEFDIAAGHHFKDGLVGLGSTGYLRDAAWRLDAIWTFLDEDSDEADFLSLVANMDYSWVWWEKNFYGFLEVFYNTLGNNQYSDALFDPNISERLDRGELFTLGRIYFSGHMRIELHPLFNVFFTMINNWADPSGILQSWITWDITRDFQITFGGNIFYGGAGTEYGGFKLPGTIYYTKPPDNIFLWLTYFF